MEELKMSEYVVKALSPNTSKYFVTDKVIDGLTKQQAEAKAAELKQAGYSNISVELFKMPTAKEIAADFKNVVMKI